MQHSLKTFLRSAASATAILVLGASAWACQPVAKSVPFFGSFIGKPSIDYAVIAKTQTVHFSGVGVASGMDDVFCNSTDEALTADLVMTGHYTISGDDGDKVIISILSKWVTVVPTAFDALGNPISLHVEFYGTYQVTGGSGHYRDANGGGTFMGSADGDTCGQYMAEDGPHVLQKGDGRWALWGTISGVKETHCGH